MYFTCHLSFPKDYTKDYRKGRAGKTCCEYQTVFHFICHFIFRVSRLGSLPGLSWLSGGPKLLGIKRKPKQVFITFSKRKCIIQAANPFKLRAMNVAVRRVSGLGYLSLNKYYSSLRSKTQVPVSCLPANWSKGGKWATEISTQTLLRWTDL